MSTRREDRLAYTAPAPRASHAVALIGYGEVGTIFAAGLCDAGVERVRAFDVQASDPAWKARADARAAAVGVVPAASAQEALAGAHLVISAVTAAQALPAAEAIAAACRPGSVVLDVNSASPQARRRCAEAVNGAGGRYVEAAVMTSVPPHGLRVPMLLGGPHAEAALPMLSALGFGASVGSGDYGVVSAIKLSRSVVIKGMEALFIESLLTARRYGVEREVLASLAETFPGIDWEKQATWFWRRVVQHGARRAEEMREAAVTVHDAGIEPDMASSTAKVQARLAQARAHGVFGDEPGNFGWRELADRLPMPDGCGTGKRR
jgi:3-hydroxyisobutyrate dehydrogenase